MTVDLAAYASEDVETLVIAWQTPLRRSGSFREAGDPLPFTLVNHVAGSESVDEGTADLVVSVHTLCDKALGAAVARDECRDTHHRMLRLATHHDDIAVGARTVNVDYLEVVETPIWVFYSDKILRKVGRYRIGLAYVPA